MLANKERTNNGRWKTVSCPNTQTKFRRFHGAVEV